MHFMKKIEVFLTLPYHVLCSLSSFLGKVYRNYANILIQAGRVNSVRQTGEIYMQYPGETNFQVPKITFIRYLAQQKKKPQWKIGQQLEIGRQF